MELQKDVIPCQLIKLNNIMTSESEISNIITEQQKVVEFGSIGNNK